MWDLLPKKIQLTVVIAAAILGVRAYDFTWAFFADKPIGLWSEISFAIFLVGTVFYILAELLWRPIWQRAPFLKSKLFPYLNGTWEGTLLSNWVNPETKQPLPPIPATFKIRQGLFGTSVTMKTGESKSHSTHVALYRYPDRDCFRIWYSYANGPKQTLLHRSQSHDGTAYLELDVSENADHLAGRYFTSRETSGDIDIKRTSLTVAV